MQSGQKRVPILKLPQLPSKQHYRFHTMVKPTGSRCNIDCQYCFYLHKSQLLNQHDVPIISDELLEQHIRQYIEAQTGEQVVFSWQGGEPTLLKIGFFEKVLKFQDKYKKSGQRIENDLQTNGLLINNDWISFLKDAGFHVGLSIDGPEELHNYYRKDRKGGGTFHYVMHAARQLNEASIPFAALCVVHNKNAKHGKEVYRFLADEMGTWRIQFNPIVESRFFTQKSANFLPDNFFPVQGDPKARPNALDSIVTEWSVDPEDYGQFLCDVWDEWLANDLGRIHVNLFETAIAQSMGKPAQMCTQAKFCGKGVALEYNGDVYSCDHFVYPEHRLGNISEQHLGDLAFSEQQTNFGLNKFLSLPDQCNTCDYLLLCWGECPKNRLIKTKNNQLGLNYLCSGLYRFYRHIDGDMIKLLRSLDS